MKKSVLLILAALMLALALTGCSTTWKKAEGVKAVSEYKLVGYTYLFTLDGNAVTFEYMDAVGDDAIPQIADTLGSVLPHYVGYDYREGGRIILHSSSKLTEAQFNAFVKSAEALIYNTIY